MAKDFNSMQGTHHKWLLELREKAGITHD